MNTKYGRIREGRVEYAPDALVSETGVVMNPSEASYLAAGWKKVVEEPPAPEDGCAVSVTEWTEGETAVTAVYKQVPVPQEDPGGLEGDDGPQQPPAQEREPGARVFSKLKLLVALKEANLWVLVKAWLEERSYYDYYLAAQTFAEDHPLFAEALAGLKEYARMSDDAAESILAACVAE